MALASPRLILGMPYFATAQPAGEQKTSAAKMKFMGRKLNERSSRHQLVMLRVGITLVCSTISGIIKWEGRQARDDALRRKGARPTLKSMAESVVKSIRGVTNGCEKQHRGSSLVADGMTSYAGGVLRRQLTERFRPLRPLLG